MEQLNRSSSCACVLALVLTAIGCEDDSDEGAKLGNQKLAESTRFEFVSEQEFQSLKKAGVWYIEHETNFKYAHQGDDWFLRNEVSSYLFMESKENNLEIVSCDRDLDRSSMHEEFLFGSNLFYLDACIGNGH